MDRVWIGRMLVRASPALQERYLEYVSQIGPGAIPIGAIAGNLLQQIGLALIINDTFVSPLTRTRGVIRLSAHLTPQDVARAYAALWQLAAEYLRHLPGIERDIADEVRRMIRLAGLSTVELLQLMRSGDPTSVERQFGGTPMLAYPAAGR